jgi:outer membrane receptor protein involved in Fe transport
VVVRGSVTAQRAHDRATDTRLSNSPGTLGTLRVESPLWSRAATLAVDWQYASERSSNRGAAADAYALTHLTWRYVPRGFKGSLAASVYNLFDREYAHPVGAEFRQDLLWQDGRTFSIRATFGF